MLCLCGTNAGICTGTFHHCCEVAGEQRCYADGICN